MNSTRHKNQKLCADEKRHVERGVMWIHDRYESGDPAAPLGCVAELKKGGRVVCTMEFPNEDNEDLQQAFESAAEKLGFIIRRTYDADPDYGYR